MTRLGVDTGGTFTDFVLLQEGRIRVHKVLSTPKAPEQAILQGIRELGLEDACAAGALQVIHGSTVATNAALEGKGVPVAFVTNAGFEDLLTLGRQERARLYDFCQPDVAPPVPPERCVGVQARMDAHGVEVVPLAESEIQRVVEQVRALPVKAVAVCLLFSWKNPEQEQRLARALKAAMPGRFVCVSSDVLPEIQEYERGMATWLNAWLGPVVKGYLERLKQALAPSDVKVMQSSAGVADVDQVADRAVNLLLSGPAGGLAAAEALRQDLGGGMLTFDMGGTSTDVALLESGLQLTRDGRIREWPVAVPMVDMHTIGAGGGSLIWLDAGGMLQVGPESAGADPGPACYGRGGTRPTVTDAHAVLGTLPAQTALGGTMRLDVQAARAAFEPLADRLGQSVEHVATGALAIATEHMAQALRMISLYRGHDPRDYRLCCFGGAGGLHVCELAEAMGMRRAVLPEMAGVFSALGMLTAPREFVQRQTVNCPWPPTSSQLHALNGCIDALAKAGLARLGSVTRSLTEVTLMMRYQGQSHTLPVSMGDEAAVLKAFSRAHERAHGFVMQRPVECVSVQVAVREPVPEVCWDVDAVPVEPERGFVAGVGEVVVRTRNSLAPGERLAGPALITESVGTLWLKSGWQLERDARGHLLLTRQTA
ncbi:MAG: hydantoinase/oxoprolinase family protein [Gammaproteobacteria bacterium]|nr:MAG: hydantoinase/oxoprolinase family protein [Gammaproteobacteria bacterium]